MHVPGKLRSDMENGRSEKIMELRYKLSSHINPSDSKDIHVQVIPDKVTNRISRSEFEELEWVIGLLGPIEGQA